MSIVGKTRHPADTFWLAMGTAFITFELLSEDLLSDAAIRSRSNRPWITRVVILAVAGHLGGFLPSWADVFDANNLVHQRIAKFWTLYRKVLDRDRTSGVGHC